jgi:hypothetical protein
MKSEVAANKILRSIFEGVTISWGETLRLSLRSSEGEEIGYAGYRRVDTEAANDWDVAGRTATNLNLIRFPKCEQGAAKATHVGIHGAGGEIIYIAELDGPMTILEGVQPQFEPGDIVVTEA